MNILIIALLIHIVTLTKIIKNLMSITFISFFKISLKTPPKNIPPPIVEVQEHNYILVPIILKSDCAWSSLDIGAG